MPLIHEQLSSALSLRAAKLSPASLNTLCEHRGRGAQPDNGGSFRMLPYCIWLTKQRQEQLVNALIPEECGGGGGIISHLYGSIALSVCSSCIHRIRTLLYISATLYFLYTISFYRITQSRVYCGQIYRGTPVITDITINDTVTNDPV